MSSISIRRKYFVLIQLINKESNVKIIKCIDRLLLPQVFKVFDCSPEYVWVKIETYNRSTDNTICKLLNKCRVSVCAISSAMTQIQILIAIILVYISQISWPKTHNINNNNNENNNMRFIVSLFNNKLTDRACDFLL